MSFEAFIQDCNINEVVNMTHAICLSGNNILAKYVKYPYKMDTLRLFFSMTKTFSSLAIGIASDLGLLHIDDCIVTFFEKELPQEPDKNVHRITIRHLLMMAGGIHENTYNELFVQDNWVEAFLRQTFPHEPGTYYRYSTHSSHMLSAIITKVSGLSLEDFLNRYLFYPMDITEAQWEQSPEGLTAGGMGLSLYPMSLVKIAQMFLNKGVYRGKRILSTQYLDLATTQQIVKQDEAGNPAKYFSGAGYGFQFHIGKDGFYRLDGAFGQLCLICPEKNRAVIVFSQNTKMEALLSLIYKHLLDDKELSGNFVWHTEYEGAGLAGLSEIPKIPQIPCGKYKLDRNSLGIEVLELFADDDGYQMILKRRSVCDTIRFSLLHDTSGKICFIKDLQEHLQEYVCAAEYDEELRLKVYLIETPYVLTYKIKFVRRQIKLDFLINVSFTVENFSVIGEMEEENGD